MSTINWAEAQKVAEEGGFTVLPHGEYDVHVSGAAGGKTSTAKDRVRVSFKVENGPHTGQLIVNDFVVTLDNANAMSIFFRHMTVLGLGSDYFTANPNAPIEVVADAIAAKRARCRVRLSTRTWQGQERNNVDALLPPAPGTAASAPPAPAAAPASVPAHHKPAGHHHTPVPATPAAVPAASAAAAASGDLPVPGTGAPALPDDLPF